MKDAAAIAAPEAMARAVTVTKQRTEERIYVAGAPLGDLGGCHLDDRQLPPVPVST